MLHFLLPATAPGFSNIIAIAAGENHSMALDKQGWIWVWGANGDEQLGLGDNDDRNTPTRIETLNLLSYPPIVQITSPADGLGLTNAAGRLALAANAEDPDGSVARVDFFYQGTNLIGSDTSAPFTTTWTNLPVGTWTFTAKAIDNKGVTATSAPVSVTILSDGDTLPDTWEQGWFGNLDQTPEGDADGDGLTNEEEQALNTNPTSKDTDGDLLTDKFEADAGEPFDPNSPDATELDSDGDGLSNLDELIFHTNPTIKDTDGDGTWDGPEVLQAGRPNDSSDGGQPPDPEQVLTLTLGIGDESGSESEDYHLVVERMLPDGSWADLLTFRSGGFGDYGERNFNQFRRAEAYRFRVEWQDSNMEGEPDYDGTALLAGEPGLSFGELGFALVDPWDPASSSQPPGATPILGSWSNVDRFPETQGTLVAILLPVELKVTDFATKSDAVPYVATSNATPPKNSELCLKADNTSEKAKIEMELPSITDATMLSKMKWKVLQKPADTVVGQGVFGGATPSSVELSLSSGSSVEDEILFEVQVGVDGASFTPAVKMNVRVVRDRLNWWFEPLTADVRWRTAKPEPRADTGDYPAHKASTYKRESLQSVYEFYRSTTAIGPSTPKANWVKPAITCFGQFHDALKAGNGNNPLVDLNSLGRPNMTAVTELPSFDTKFGALRSAMAKQTTFPSDPNPTLRATQWPARVQWATAAATALGDAKMPRGLLMEIWTKEGSMAVNSEDHASNNNNITSFSVWPLGFSAAASAPPASANDAKTIYIYDVAYICLGSDFLLKHSGGADNQPDLQDYPAALAHFKTQADATGGAGIGDRIVSNLTVAGSAGNYTISANAAFYEDMLTLMAKHFLSVWQTEGPDVTYMAYNMGIGQFNNLKASLGNVAYPERARLGITDWSIHYEIRTGEWTEPRRNAQWFHCGRVAFEAKYP